MKNIIQYESEDKEVTQKSNILNIIWYILGFAILIIWIFSISMEQADKFHDIIPDTKNLTLAFFSYNLIVVTIFCSILSLFCFLVNSILKKIFFTGSLFFTFVSAILTIPLIMPVFIHTGIYVANNISYKYELIQMINIHQVQSLTNYQNEFREQLMQNNYDIIITKE